MSKLCYICDPDIPPPVMDLPNDVVAANAVSKDNIIIEMGTPKPICIETSLVHNLRILVGRNQKENKEFEIGVCLPRRSETFILRTGCIKKISNAEFFEGKDDCYYIPILATTGLPNPMMKILASSIKGCADFPPESLSYIRERENGYNLCMYILFGKGVTKREPRRKVWFDDTVLGTLIPVATVMIFVSIFVTRYR